MKDKGKLIYVDDLMSSIIGDKSIIGYSYSRIKQHINEAKPVDAVEVVRCRDCKHCDPENHHCDHHMGTATPLRRKPDDFCSYGEWKEGDDNGT